MEHGYEVVVRTRNRHEYSDLHLVLDSAGIPARGVQRDGWWCILVHEADASRALTELAAYQSENRSVAAVPRPIYGGAGLGVFLYLVIVIAFAVVTFHDGYGFDWYAAGRMHAKLVTQGELWRVVTALMLHTDTPHVVGNLAFGAVFGLLAGQALGGGFAWLSIVLGGALGNGLNAVLRPPEHLSIGASTAVFAALGIVVAQSVWTWRSHSDRWVRRWSPLIGGLLLFAYTGIGDEGTDVLAHVTGMLGGMLFGSLALLVPPGGLSSTAWQRVAAVAALAILAGAWTVGLMLAGCPS